MTEILTTTRTSALQNFYQDGHLPVPVKFPTIPSPFQVTWACLSTQSNTIMSCQTK